ncbi:hypothetical protein SSP35_06_01410 [Streptomyces sp. NBRC 110611]|nr:hypothetical protein SSP35_06_01410 [Streptomyces sp. NBRC 110611]
MARTGRDGPPGPGGAAPVTDSGVFPVRPAPCARADRPAFRAIARHPGNPLDALFDPSDTHR